MRRRPTATVLLVLLAVLLAGPAAASEAPEPSPAPSPSATPSPTGTAPAPASPELGDGIREIPTEEEGADAFSVITMLLFFAIAMGVLVLIIRTGMRATDRED